MRHSTRATWRLVLPFVLASGISACARGAVTTTANQGPEARSVAPNADELKRDLYVFASDSFGGRRTATPYADKAARWLATRLAQLGLEPGGDSGYFHRVPLDRSTVASEPLVVSSPAGRSTLAANRDVVYLSSLGPGAPSPKDSVNAEAVFASYGLIDPALGMNDYAGLAVSGKVVVIAGGVPAGLAPDKAKELANPQALFGRLQAAILRQPAAVVLLLPDSLFGMLASQFNAVQVSLASGGASGAPNRVLPLVAVARLGAGVVPTSWPANIKAQYSGTRISGGYRERVERVNGYNVVGIVRGTDPALKNTYVAYGAHYDHIGVTGGVQGDTVNNGADDDGSGSMSLLAIARAWSQGPRPKRSALFVWHVGEEEGLFGSQAFTDHPSVPLDSIVAQLNADMIGRNGTDSLYIVGPGAAPNGQSATLGAVLDSVNAAGSKPFAFNREWDTTTHPERIYYRSDHFNYARKGIPIVFFTSGLHEQYHKPSDEASLINYDKLAKVSDLMYRLGLTLGNRPTRPKPSAVP